MGVIFKRVIRWITRLLPIPFLAVGVLICTSFAVVAPTVGTVGGSEVVLPTSPYVVAPVKESVDRSAEMAAFEAKNRDCVGWLYIPGTDIDNEVVQSYNNDYYLRRTSLKKYYSEHGCYFADYRNRLEAGEEKDRNIILYGHNIWDDGTMFSQLLKYEDWQYFAEHPYLYFQTADGMCVYRVVAAYYTFTDFYYIRPNGTDGQWSYILEESLAKSEFLTDLDLPLDGNYLTLSTCCYKYYYSWGSRRMDQRFVVLGLEIDPENPPEYHLPVTNPHKKSPYD